MKSTRQYIKFAYFFTKMNNVYGFQVKIDNTIGNNKQLFIKNRIYCLMDEVIVLSDLLQGYYQDSILTTIATIPFQEVLTKIKAVLLLKWQIFGQFFQKWPNFTSFHKAKRRQQIRPLPPETCSNSQHFSAFESLLLEHSVESQEFFLVLRFYIKSFSIFKTAILKVVNFEFAIIHLN